MRSAIIPLLVIELSFLAVYWVSNLIIYRQNIAELNSLSHDYLSDVARREAQTIDTSLADVSRRTKTFALLTQRALNGSFEPTAEDKARYGFSSDGAFYTKRDIGTTAGFYSNVRPIGPKEIAKVWKLAALEPIMIDIARSDTSISSIYFNSHDSYNLIYPYVDVIRQYPRRMAIPTYNFYYEADAAHNPRRVPVWTDAYVDPAGHGWMVSSIVPVWEGNSLEGVAGIDLTLDTVVNRLLDLHLPWDAYALLVDRKGGIIALPPAGERDFGLKELTDHHYAQAIRSDTFKPDQFNLRKRADMKTLVAAMGRSPDGVTEFTFAGAPHLASFARIAGPDWRLVVIAPTARIHAKADALRQKFETVGLVMLAALFFFYVLFFMFLNRRASRMSARIAAPLDQISALFQRIGTGDYRQTFEGSEVEELDTLGHRLVETGKRLGAANESIRTQQRTVSLALMRQRAANEEQVRFVRIMSHELRTPLSVIDSGAQTIDRKAEAMRAADLRKRAGRLRSSVQTISNLLSRLVDNAAVDIASSPRDQRGVIDANLLVREVAASHIPQERLGLELATEQLFISDGPAFPIALSAVLDNCVRYSIEDGRITIGVHPDGEAVHVTVVDKGPGIPGAELAFIGQRFYRGRNSTGIEGTGMGLYIARKLMMSAGGDLTLASDETGTTVRITLPIALREGDLAA